MPASNNLTIKIKGLEAFRAAIKRNPKMVLDELKKFFIRAKARYTATIIRNPWSVGGSGGGAPVDTGALRDSHQAGTKIDKFRLVIGPDEKVAPYAKYVHGRGYGEVNSRTGVKSRPWLNYAFDKEEKEIRRLGDEMLLNLVKDLAK
jgi:hypothetical protein